MPPSRFAADTAVEALGDGRYAASIHRAWWVAQGPNGGYVAAILLRALNAEVGDASRPPRSLSIHYLAPPDEGEATVHVAIERSGRSMTATSARFVQEGSVRALALAIHGPSRTGPTFDDASAPRVPPPDECPPVPDPPAPIPFKDHWDSRHGLGSLPGDRAGEAVTGGWIRLLDPQPLDHVVVAAMSDAWPPAMLGRVRERALVPTLDLNVHFRVGELPPTDDFCLVRFTSRVAREGYVEEDGEIWSPDGTLLAQSRQLALEIQAPG